MRSTATVMLFMVIIMLMFSPLEGQSELQDGGATATHILDIDGRERHYHLFTPENVQGEMPLIVALHDEVSSGKAMQALSGFDNTGYFVAYPESAVAFWDDGRVAVGLQAGQPIDDLGFINGLVEHLLANHPIDANRVYLAGYGNGGTMSYRLACTLPERFRAIGIVSALMWDFQQDDCAASSSATEMIILHGHHDAYYPLQGREIRSHDDTMQTMLSLDETVAFWGAQNGCGDGAVSADGVVTSYTCADERRLVAYSLPNISHQWPRTGDISLQHSRFDATSALTAFFEGNGLPEPEIAPELHVPRSFHLYVPSTYTPDVPLPLVLMLHGNPSNGVNMAYLTEMNEYAEEHGFIVVYPDAVNDGGWTIVPDDFARESDRDDDLRFLLNLVDDLDSMLAIDSARRYVAGFSNGGFMTQHVACAASDVFAAYAAVGSVMFLGQTELCAEQSPVPILLMHGTDDTVVAWDGLFYDEAGEVVRQEFSVAHTLGFWLQHNDCDSEGIVTDLPSRSDTAQTAVTTIAYPDCSDEAEVLFYYIFGGGHNWPGVPGLIPEEIGGWVTTDIHASEVIWEFFSRHARQ